MLNQQLVLEIFKYASPMLGAMIGASAVLVAGILADRRKTKQENFSAELREKTLLTGMHTIRNYIAICLKEHSAHGRTSALRPLRSAHRYVDKLIDKTPPHGEALLMSVIEIGLKLDALLSLIDRRADEPALQDQVAFAAAVTNAADELAGSLEQFAIVAHSSLNFLSEEDLAAIIQSSSAQKGPPSAT